MAFSTDPSVLANNARCFGECIPPGMQLSVQTYLLALFAGADTTNPSAIANAATCFFDCVPTGNQMPIQNYLLALLAQQDTSNPSALANQGRCFEMCLPLGLLKSVRTYLFAVLNGVDGTDPGVLANRATCFERCLSQGDQLAVQNYLLAQIILPGTDASTIQNLARCFSMCIGHEQNYSLSAYLFAQVVLKSLPPCFTPTVPNIRPMTTLSSTTLLVHWLESNTGSLICSYTIQYGTSSGVYTNSLTVGAGVTSVILSGLSPSTTYFAVVKANACAGCSSANSFEVSGTTLAGGGGGSPADTLAAAAIAYWRMDAAPFTNEPDTTGHGWTITDINASIDSGNNQPGIVKINKYRINLNFGFAPWFEVNKAIDQRGDNAPFTVAGWVYDAGASNNIPFFGSVIAGGGPWLGWQLGRNNLPTPTYQILAQDTAGTLHTFNGTVPLTAPATFLAHLAVVSYDGTKLSLSIDNQATPDTFPITGVVRGQNNFCFGNFPDHPANANGPGAWEEFGYYNKAISAAEITYLYNNNLGNRPTGL